MKKLIYLLLYVSLLGCSSKDLEFDCIEYVLKNESFSNVYGEDVFYYLTLGNKVDNYAADIYLGDSQKMNVFGKLYGGLVGANSVVEGNYQIRNGFVHIKWDNNTVLENLPTELKILNKDFGSNKSRINMLVDSLLDVNNNKVYSIKSIWNVK